MTTTRSPADAPERQLALLLVGTRALRERNRARIDELSARVDYDALAAFLCRSSMLSLIGRRLLELGDAPPSRFAEAVTCYGARAHRQAVGQALVTTRALGALAEADIRALPLKGPLLSERIYGELDARVSADIDLLLSRADLPRAMASLECIGYRSPFAGDMRRRPPEVHEVLRSAAGLPPIELHWRLHWYDEHFGAELLRRATPDNDGHLRPTPAYELAALLLAYAREGFAGLRQLADLTTWWDRFADAVTPAELDELIDGDPSIARPLATAAAIAQRLGGLPAERLLAPEVRARASRGAARLSNWPLRGPYPQIGANVALADWFLAAPGQRRALFGRHLWLSEEVLSLRRRETGPQPLRLSPGRVLQLRMLHLVRICGRYAIALPRICTRAGWAPAPAWLDGTVGEGA
ncbi:MAG TPA: nucleotidyltransferase family protein [Solirubrobacteraceae bacterium]|nr:nucleotidyltransferase family protein [Solirubrobacteraceae bacterium]